MMMTAKEEILRCGSRAGAFALPRSAFSFTGCRAKVFSMSKSSIRLGQEPKFCRLLLREKPCKNFPWEQLFRTGNLHKDRCRRSLARRTIDHFNREQAVAI